ncbi:hypothetical protein E4U53_007327, partial [Claviceps sorghi]
FGLEAAATARLNEPPADCFRSTGFFGRYDCTSLDSSDALSKASFASLFRSAIKWPKNWAIDEYGIGNRLMIAHLLQ